MELYINSTWTEPYGDTYVAEAIAWSENGNHATIYATGSTAEEADARLLGALRELELVPKEIAGEAKEEEEEEEAKEAILPVGRSVCLSEALSSEGLDKGFWHRLVALWGVLNVPFHRSWI